MAAREASRQQELAGLQEATKGMTAVMFLESTGKEVRVVAVEQLLLAETPILMALRATVGTGSVQLSLERHVLMEAVVAEVLRRT